jgi:hypothetical protein
MIGWLVLLFRGMTRSEFALDASQTLPAASEVVGTLNRRVNESVVGLCSNRGFDESLPFI